MPTVTRDILVDASQDAVWAKICDLSTYPEWNVTHAGFPNGTPGLAPAVSFKEKVTILGMPGEISWVVEEANQPARLVLRGKGPMGTKLRYTYALIAQPGGTRISATAEFEGLALGPMLGPLAQASQKAMSQSLDQLRELLTT